MALPIALQLYTIRDVLAKDFEGGLKAVAKMGYKYVEFAGFYDHKPADVRKLIDGLGLTAISSHTGIDGIESGLAGVIDAAKTIGYRHVVVPYLPNTFWSPKGYAQTARRFTKAGRALAKAGLSFAYHNHSFEFHRLKGGVRGMDIIYDTTDRKVVNAELDVFWVWHGNDCPVAWMKKLAKRVPLLHIKDMSDKPDRSFTEVGTGIVDLKAVVKAAPKAGVEYLIVEQDGNWIDGDPLKSVAISLKNLKRIAGK